MRTLVLAMAVPLLFTTNTVIPGRAEAAPKSTRALAPGDMAPDFSLLGSDGRTYRLSSYRGKQVVVLAWFAKAFTDG